MFWLKRILAVGAIASFTLPVCAFTFSYGSWLDIKGVEKVNNRVQLPLTRKKYKNVKITDKSLYQFLNRCQTDCQYPQPKQDFEIIESRAATSREGMWIADIEFNGEIILTVLVFENKKGLAVKLPDVVEFKDKAFQKQIEKAIQTQLEQTL